MGDFTNPPEPDGDTLQPAEADLTILDGSELLRRVDGCHDLVAELVDLFDVESRKQIEAIHEAIERRDHEAVMRTAHCLKGAAINISARAAFDAALELEQTGRDERIEHAGEACQSLEHELERLRPALEALKRECRP